LKNYFAKSKVKNMKHTKSYIACLFILTTVVFYCYAGVMLQPDCWAELQNVSRFHELYSETNIPPKIISDCSYHFPRRRLLWAVTDGTNYVMQHEYYDYADFGNKNLATNYSICVFSLGHEDEGACADYSQSFKDYETFVHSCHGYLGGRD
jgi:hypothetical protein